VLSRIERFRSYEAIVAKITGLIESGELKPGDRLPPERELAEMLGTSRATVREACRVLEHMGLLDSRIGSGRYITGAPAAPDPAGDSRSQGTEAATLLDYLALRKMVEVPIAGLAAQNVDDVHVVALRQAVAMMSDPAVEPLAADLAFHLAVVEAAGNSYIASLMRTGSFHLYRMATLTTSQPGRRAEVIAEHRQINEAIVERDSELARHLMAEHLDRAEAALRSTLARPGKD
jgi:GntR family transcriptional repressor for pyruvate dehydrogenase complex